MKNLGTLKVVANGVKTKVYVTCVGDEIFIDTRHNACPPLANGYLDIIHSEVYAGTLEQWQHDYSRRVCDFLVENGYAKETEPATIFGGCGYVPTGKLTEQEA